LETLSLGDAIRGIVAVTEHYRQQRGHKLDLALPEEPLHVRGDPARERLRSSTSIPLIVAVTGMGRPQDLAHGRAARFDDQLIKPVDAKRLLEVVGGARCQG
jgi:CheY-like chemotaxis protein